MKTNPNPDEIYFLLEADTSLNAMSNVAQEMQLKGVAVVAYIEDPEKNTWISKMKICGALKNEEANFLAIAYTKASEMADSLQNSGTTERKILLGEFGFLGGIIKKTNKGYYLSVFSGATGEEDTVIAEAGLALLKN